jgi:hypothetical protein
VVAQYRVSCDELGTHIAWELEGVFAHPIDWFWSNMKKGFVLWHPETLERGETLAGHCAGEIGNRENFLHPLQEICRVVGDPHRNPVADLSVAGKGRDACHVHNSGT